MSLLDAVDLTVLSTRQNEVQYALSAYVNGGCFSARDRLLSLALPTIPPGQHRRQPGWRVCARHSLGTGDEIAYSDFDALVILKDDVLRSPEQLARTARNSQPGPLRYVCDGSTCSTMAGLCLLRRILVIIVKRISFANCFATPGVAPGSGRHSAGFRTRFGAGAGRHLPSRGKLAPDQLGDGRHSEVQLLHFVGRKSAVVDAGVVDGAVHIVFRIKPPSSNEKSGSEGRGIIGICYSIHKRSVRHDHYLPFIAC